MKHITLTTTLLLAMLLGILLSSGTALACSNAGFSTHIGQLLNLDADKKTFSIRDAETRKVITFAANDEIITGLDGFAGNLMVNYQEDDVGLTAVGVTF